MNDKIKKVIQIMTSPRYWIIVAGLGIWMIVLQNFGFFGEKSQKVYVTGGYVDAQVSNTVNANVDNTVDVNIDEVLGYPIGCHRSYTIDGREYQAIDVFKSNW